MIFSKITNEEQKLHGRFEGQTFFFFLQFLPTSPKVSLEKQKNHNFYLTQVCKVVFNERMTQFQERWQKVEKGKKEMKMNFIKYNNIVKVN